MFLLVRNVFPLDKPGFGNPVALVKEAIDEISRTDEGKELAEITLDVLPGGRPQDPHCSSAYIELTKDIKLLDPLPRPDLLTDWQVALTTYRPMWQTVWAPQKKGKDRRMIVRFRAAESKEKVPLFAVDKIRAFLNSKGHKTTGGYVSFNGLVDITFADTASVDAILESTHYVVPTLSKDGMHVSPPKYIPIEYPFKLCIGGLNDYEGLDDTIEKWIRHKYKRDNAARLTRLVASRNSLDRDYYIFAMDSWESTLLVLRDLTEFRTYFTHSPLLTDPRLLFDVNSSGFARKSLTSTIDAGAGLVSDAITEIKRDISDFRKEQSENNNLVQRQVAAIHVNMESQTNALMLIGNQMHQQGLSLLAGRDEKAIECRKSAVESNLMFEMMSYRLATDLQQKTAINDSITALQKERRELADELAVASNTTLRLLGPTPGAIVPHPPVQPSSTDAGPVVSTTPPCLSPSRPVTPQTAARTQAALPTTPARTLAQPSAILPLPFSLTPVTPVSSSINTFVIPSISTPTPASRAGVPSVSAPAPVFRPGVIATKKDRHANLLATSAKQLKMSGRHNVTRSETRTLESTLATAGSVSDTFSDDADMVVSPHSDTESLHLITAPIDKGDWLCPRRRLTVNTSDAPKRAEKPVLLNHEGRVHIPDVLLFRNLSCFRFCRNSLPLLLFWAFSALFFMSLIKSADAAPSAAGSFSLFALNTNGFVHPMKIDATNRAIAHRNPDIVVITETKTNSARSSKMSYETYQFFEESGVPVSGHHLYKWGVILGVKKGITVSQRLNITHPALLGRLVAVDVIIPLDTGDGFVHRVIAAYAPWDTTDTSETAAYWSEVTKLCISSPNSWTLLGDLNATVSQAERRTGGTDARLHFTNFLRLSKGSDLWSNNPERSRYSDWTCKPRLSTDGGSIIDRVVVSSDCYLDSEIFAADAHLDFVPMTDHRPVIARIILKPPGRNAAKCIHEPFTPVLNRPRIKFPDSADKHLFQAFRDQTDTKIRQAGLQDLLITDHATFNTLYTQLTEVVNVTASEVFGRINRKQRNVHKIITNQTIQQLQGRSRAIGGALRLANDPTSSVSHAAVIAFRQSSTEHLLNPSSHLTLRSFLLAKRKIINKNLYRERSSEVYARVKRYDTFRITQALAGGSTKRLVQSAEFVPLPMSVNTIDGSGKLLTSPEHVKAETRRYWEKLYARQPLPVLDKPWLHTESVKRVKARVQTNPFVWPRAASLSDFRALIRRGNARPSPGPDGMEKWCVKSLSDFSLAPVLALHNYMTMNSCFPGDTKDMYLTMFHKRGLRTDLNNWRGLMISNFIANSPMTWLNYLLNPFIATNAILPDTQVATQQGVQTRDLTSFLASILTWSNRHKTTVYALKRDQMKGFDYLAPEGFYDAVLAYGLPASIVDLDKAAQTNTRVFIRTAHGLTEPIFVSGVAKQGGPISPLKSTLTTSLGHRYLDDFASRTPGALTISSSSHERSDPHLPDDRISLPVRMVEATDDSIIFARSLPALQSFCLLEERFQFAYGWLTNWLKSSCHVISPSGPQPDKVSLPSITVKPGVSPLVVTHHDIPLIIGELDFLRVKIDNPSHRYCELQEFIDAFTFPKFVGPTPITLIRKIAMQSIASRARALLSFQPITDMDALKLDRQLAAKVHAISGFPWMFNTEIATLPVSLHGFDFPSIRRINAAIAIDGLARDLNHHILAYRNMALITLADWTCHVNNCINPLVEPGILKHFTRRLHLHTIPAAWIIAQRAMGDMKPPLRLCSTDHSHVIEGDVSISHSLRLMKKHDDSFPSGIAANSLRAAGLTLIKHLGSWRITNHVLRFIPLDIDHFIPTRRKLSKAARSNWHKTTAALALSSIDWFFFGSSDLLTPPLQRRDLAENHIQSLAATCKFPPSSLKHDKTFWASDGSMIPAASSISDSKSITSAVSGPLSLIMRVTHRNASILQGEQLGLVAALVLSDVSPQIYTDHLNSTSLIDDSRTAINQDRRLRSMNGRSYYRWILDLVSRKSATISYTKAHTTDSTLSACLNREADHLASASQKHISVLPLAPIPTFFMDRYSFHREPDGWIESNIRHFVDHFYAISTADSLSLLPKHRMSTWLYDLNPPPPWIYTKATSAYTALIQLYARSGQLPTAEGMHQKNATSVSSQACRFGCLATESPHHIFAICGRFSELRNKELASLSLSVKGRLDDAAIGPPHQSSILQLAKFIFSDSDLVWPLHSTVFFLGQIPKVEPLLSPLSMPNSVNRSRLIHNIATDLHLSSVRLASRIFGDLQKEISRRHAQLYGRRS